MCQHQNWGQKEEYLSFSELWWCQKFVPITGEWNTYGISSPLENRSQNCLTLVPFLYAVWSCRTESFQWQHQGCRIRSPGKITWPLLYQFSGGGWKVSFQRIFWGTFSVYCLQTDWFLSGFQQWSDLYFLLLWATLWTCIGQKVEQKILNKNNRYMRLLGSHYALLMRP